MRSFVFKIRLAALSLGVYAAGSPRAAQALRLKKMNTQALPKNLHVPKEKGYTAFELNLQGYKASALMQAGYKASELMQAGYEAHSLVEQGCKVTELKEAGYTAQQLYDARCDAQQMLQAQYKVEEMKKVGYTAEQLEKSEKTKAIESERRIQVLKNLKKAGELCEMAGVYTEYEMRQAGLTDSSIKNYYHSRLKAAEPQKEAQELEEETYTERQQELRTKLEGLRKSHDEAAWRKLSKDYTVADMRELGCPPVELKKGNFSLSDIRKCGYPAFKGLYKPCELREANYEPSSMLDAGFTLQNLADAGYTLADVMKEEVYLSGRYTDEWEKLGEVRWLEAIEEGGMDGVYNAYDHCEERFTAPNMSNCPF